jgi:ABC-type transport system substrate-binding protein
MLPSVADSRRPAISRRIALRLFGGGVAVALLAACGPIAPQPAPIAVGSGALPATAAAVSAPPTSVPQAQGQSGGTLRIADSDPQRLDGHLILANGINITWMPYDRLVQYDDKLQPQSGFKPTIKAMEGPAILQYADLQKNPGLWINQSGYAHLGPQALCTISRHWNIGANASGFVSEPYRQLVNTIATEPDAAKRTALYGQLNDLLLDEQFVITVASNAEYVVTRANVQGFHWDGHGARAYSDVWLA